MGIGKTNKRWCIFWDITSKELLLSLSLKKVRGGSRYQVGREKLCERAIHRRHSCPESKADGWQQLTMGIKRSKVSLTFLSRTRLPLAEPKQKSDDKLLCWHSCYGWAFLISDQDRAAQRADQETARCKCPAQEPIPEGQGMAIPTDVTLGK